MTLAVLIAAKGACDPGPMFDALHAAGAFSRDAVEVHLVCDRGTRLLREPPTAVRLHRLPESLSVFQLWGFGVTAARSRHVAILDIHCPPADGWLQAVLRRLLGDPLAFYGPVEPAYPWEDRRIAGYLTEYVQFHRPIPESLREVAGSNLIVRRTAALQAVDESGAFVKTRLLSLLETPPQLDSDAVILHGKPFGLRAYVARRYRHGRSYAAQRHGDRAWLRAAAALSTAGLPILRVWRIWRHARLRPRGALACRQRLGLLLAAETAWSIGELCGYVAGESADPSRLD